MKRLSVVINFVVLLCLSASLALAVPQVITYQGKLTDSTGTPLNGIFHMTFAIFDIPSGGSQLWSEDLDVDVVNGIYNVELGQIIPLNISVFDDDSRFLEVSILNPETNRDEILSPRQPVTSTAFAIKAGEAEMLSGGYAAYDLDQSAHLTRTDNPHEVTASQVGAVDLSDFFWAKLGGIPAGFADNIDNVGIISEEDPTVPDFLKDGVSWLEVTNKPAFIGDITGVHAGSGLSGGGIVGDVTLNVRMPLELQGSRSTSFLDIDPLDSAIISAVNNADILLGLSVGGYFEASGSSGKAVYALSPGSTGTAVYGFASNSSDVTNYGGYFRAAGQQAKAVYGEASSTEFKKHYGGYFKANGEEGVGVYGEASGMLCSGVHGESSNIGVSGHANDTDYGGIGGKFDADGIGGIGVAAGGDTGVSAAGYTAVYGAARDKDSNTQGYGGYFETKNQSGTGLGGTGVYAQGKIGVEGRGDTGVSGAGYIAVYGAARDKDSDTQGYGGFFETKNQSGTGLGGTGVYAQGKTGVEGKGMYYDFYASGDGVNYAPFTGAHEVRLADDVPDDIKPGMIMSVTGETLMRKDDSENISLSSTLPTVTLAKKSQDKAVFGVFISKTKLPKNHWYEKKDSETFGMVNALGEGRVWVTDINGPLEPGDYITTSAVQGYGRKQDDDVLHSYTLGKATEKVDWENVTDTIEYQGRWIKRYLIAVVYTSG